MPLEEIQAREVQIAAGPSAAEAGPRWSLATRLAFRLVFVYQILYSFPFPLSLIPGSDRVLGWYDGMFAAITTWSAAHILHLSQPVVFSPFIGGDSLFGWVQNLVKLVLAVIAAVLWSVFDRKRAHYRGLQEWLWLYVRLVLGTALIGYGALKVIKVQFPDLFLWRLLSPYGDSSPGGLLWSFMGYSKLYNVFTGSVEMLGGILLFVPRLATLGALLSIGAMANVFMLNLSYDVSVKLYSLNLLLMGVYLMAPEAQRMLNVFVLNRTAAPVPHAPLFHRKWLNAGMVALQIVLLLAVGSSELYQGYQRYTQSGDGAPPPPLFGVYDVDEFIVNGQPRPPVFNDATRWHRITFERYNLMAVFAGSEPVKRYKTKIDLPKHDLELRPIVSGNWKAAFHFDEPSPGLLTLRGEMDGQQIEARLRRLELKSFPLYANGFHWIQ
ncbi:MAG TPA: hypothetical protein VIB39_03470 [Candidatus Angelobacter sp.]|jgi:uncharacterized membrane protein YphA (DoxX/SURF4 family)